MKVLVIMDSTELEAGVFERVLRKSPLQAVPSQIRLGQWMLLRPDYSEMMHDTEIVGVIREVIGDGLQPG